MSKSNDYNPIFTVEQKVFETPCLMTENKNDDADGRWQMVASKKEKKR